MPLTQQQFGSHLWVAAEMLRGRIDSGDYKPFILGLLIVPEGANQEKVTVAEEATCEMSE